MCLANGFLHGRITHSTRGKAHWHFVTLVSHRPVRVKPMVKNAGVELRLRVLRTCEAAVVMLDLERFQVVRKLL